MKVCQKCGAENGDNAAKCLRCDTPLPVFVQPARVTVTDIDMPIGSMVSFMIKWAIAAIPALFILSLFGFMVVLIFGAMFSGY